MLRRLPVEIPRIDIRIAVAYHEVIFAVAVKVADADFVDPRFRITELVGNIGVALELSSASPAVLEKPAAGRTRYFAPGTGFFTRKSVVCITGAALSFCSLPSAVQNTSKPIFGSSEASSRHDR